MEKDRHLNTVISGSFKFKPEIDSAHEEFRDYNVTVLAPDIGWLYIPSLKIIKSTEQFKPLPTERGMAIREIEEAFLEHILDSDFVYIMNLEGYIGNSTAFEIGYTLSSNIPMYAAEPLNYDLMEIYDISMRKFLDERIRIMSIKDAVADFNERLANG